jgi:hypothetical protein
MLNKEHPRRLLRSFGFSAFLAIALLSGRSACSGDLVLFPAGDVYPPYIADPHRVGFGAQWLAFTRTDIADSGDDRVALRAGGRFGIVRLNPGGRADRGWQLSVEGGFNGQFDIDHSLDNIGWDGRYGLMLTTRQTENAAFRFAVLHDSSHVGDEYGERTGRRRIGYTRHELAAGLSWHPLPSWRTYVEGGRAYQLSNDELQEPGRIQAGVEYESGPGFWNGAAGWYAAADASAMEERRWRTDICVQTGLVWRSGERTWRFGLEWYNGRPPIGEFFKNTEKYISLGLWIDI